MHPRDDRFPCPRCGEGALPQARVCPHCRGSLLFVVEVAAPLPPREAYAAARELSELPGGPIFLAAKRALDGGGRLAAEVPFGLAQEIAGVLRGHAGECRVAPADAGPRSLTAATRGPRQRPLLYVTVALVGTAILAWWLGARGRESSAALTGPSSPRAVAAAQPVAVTALPAREIGRLATRSTAALRCGSTTGSGFFVSGDQLVTNAHVLCGDHEPLQVLLADGRELTGLPERSDRRLDLALVRVAGAAVPPLALGDASTLNQGDTVYFYGSPRGLDFTLAQALVSHAGRSWRGLTYVQIDGNVNPGNSGGPLLDTVGRVVGVVTLRVDNANGLGLAVPVNYLYDGRQPLLRAPAAVDAQAWSRLVQRATDDDEREAAEAREDLALPGLAGAYLTRAGTVVAVVARHSEQAPLVSDFDFRLERDGITLCWPTGAAATWQRMGSLDERLDAATRDWLERHGMGMEVWAASVPLQWAGCPPPSDALGAELVLPVAKRGADRAPLSALPL